ncbi:MAG: hypothetical protein ACRC45_00665 [Cetobacterium sp.]
MKNICILLLLLICAGCVNIQIAGDNSTIHMDTKEEDTMFNKL